MHHLFLFNSINTDKPSLKNVWNSSLTHLQLFKELFVFFLLFIPISVAHEIMIGELRHCFNTESTKAWKPTNWFFPCTKKKIYSPCKNIMCTNKTATFARIPYSSHVKLLKYGGLYWDQRNWRETTAVYF